jgi:dTDP-glucose 4,6-dehydratase
MNVLVTGALGFIGSHVCRELLRSGHAVTGIDVASYAADPSRILDLDIDVRIADICDEEKVCDIIDQKKIDWIVNTAAETHVDNSIKSASSFIHSNVDGTRSILESCKRTGAKLLHFSTDEVYGVPDLEPFTEESPLKPRNPYSATKAAADHLVYAYAVTHGLRSITIRPSNNFGVGQHGEKFIPTVIRSIRSGGKVPVYGDGMQEREWTSVKDTARAVSFLLKNPEDRMGQVYNLSSGFSLHNIEVLRSIVEILRPGDNYLDHVQSVQDRPGHDKKYWISSSKIENEGFRFTESFEDTLREVCS